MLSDLNFSLPLVRDMLCYINMLHCLNWSAIFSVCSHDRERTCNAVSITGTNLHIQHAWTVNLELGMCFHQIRPISWGWWNIPSGHKATDTQPGSCAGCSFWVSSFAITEAYLAIIHTRAYMAQALKQDWLMILV